MIILGIDPGTATTGFGIIKIANNEATLLDYGCIQTPKHEPLAERLNQITKDLDEITALWKPDAIAIEELFFSKNVKTAMHIAHARGAVIQKLANAGYQIHEYKPQKIKEAVCGYGKAAKWQVQKMVQLILNMPELPRPDDAADALATALCHSQSLQFNALANV